MCFFKFLLVFIGVFISCDASLNCPCHDSDTNRTVWKSIKCLNNNKALSPGSVSIGGHDENRLIPIHCNQTLRKCVETDLCMSGWSEWTRAGNSRISCSENSTLWKRTCNENAAGETDRSHQNSTKRRDGGFGLGDSTTRINDISSSVAEVTRINLNDSNVRTTRHVAATVSNAIKNALRLNVDLGKLRANMHTPHFISGTKPGIDVTSKPGRGANFFNLKTSVTTSAIWLRDTPKLFPTTASIFTKPISTLPPIEKNSDGKTTSKPITIPSDVRAKTSSTTFINNFNQTTYVRIFNRTDQSMKLNNVADFTSVATETKNEENQSNENEFTTTRNINQDAKSSNSKEEEHSLSILIIIVIGVVAAIGWICFITACCCWSKTRQEQQRQKKHQFSSSNRFHWRSGPSIRSVTSASGLYESVGPELPPPRFPIYSSLRLFNSRYQSPTDYDLAEAGLYRNADDLYIVPATLPRNNKRSATDARSDESNNNVRSELSSSKVARISHSEFHQNGYLSPLHLCDGQHPGYVSFIVSSDHESQECEESESNRSNKPKKKRNSAISFTFPFTKSNESQDESDRCPNSSQVSPHYEKKTQKYQRKIRRKNRPNIKIMINRASSRERQRSFSTSDEIPRTPRFSTNSPRTPQLVEAVDSVVNETANDVRTPQTPLLVDDSRQVSQPTSPDFYTLSRKSKSLLETEDARKKINAFEMYQPQMQQDVEKEDENHTPTENKNGSKKLPVIPENAPSTNS